MQATSRKGNRIALSHSLSILPVNPLTVFTSISVNFCLPLAIFFLSNWSIYLLVSFSVLISISLSLFFYLRVVDPGIIDFPKPKSTAETSPAEERKVTLEFKPVKLEGDTRELAVLYCKLCDRTLSSDSFHCEECDCCIEEFDGHSFLIGNCVGRDNRRLFLLFLACQTALHFAVMIEFAKRILYVRGIFDVFATFCSVAEVTCFASIFLIDFVLFLNSSTFPLMSNLAYASIQKKKKASAWTQMWSKIIKSKEEEEDKENFIVALKQFQKK